MRRAAPPSEIWVDDRVVIAASSIEGCGLVAAAPIPAGEIVLRLAGRLVSTSELERIIAAADADPEAPYVDTITVYDDAHLVLPPSTAAHFGNHSCDPTLWHVGAYELAMRRAVEPGEELTLDYGTVSGAAGFEMACACGSTCCRSTITSDDWRLPELQERYGTHWTPALAARIAAAGAAPSP